MTAQTCDKATTALLFIDPYNGFLSEGGKLWPRVKDGREWAHAILKTRGLIAALHSA